MGQTLASSVVVKVVTAECLDMELEVRASGVAFHAQLEIHVCLCDRFWSSDSVTSRQAQP